MKLSWDTAKKAAYEGKRVYFHHRGKTIEITKDAKLRDLYAIFGLTGGITVHDIVYGKYSIQ